MLFRLLQWALRIPSVAQGHDAGCCASLSAPLGCKCNVRKLRPPALREVFSPSRAML